jgi:DNA-binding transcriptional regulator YdaS (Cro superfamily)
MKDEYSEYELSRYIEEQVKQYGSQSSYAKHLGISASYLNDYLSLRRKPGAKILSALGLVKTTLYVRFP